MVRHSLVDEITGDLDDLNTFMMNLKKKSETASVLAVLLKHSKKKRREIIP